MTSASGTPRSRESAEEDRRPEALEEPIDRAERAERTERVEGVLGKLARLPDFRRLPQNWPVQPLLFGHSSKPSKDWIDLSRFGGGCSFNVLVHCCPLGAALDGLLLPSATDLLRAWAAWVPV